MNFWKKAVGTVLVGGALAAVPVAATSASASTSEVAKPTVQGVVAALPPLPTVQLVSQDDAAATAVLTGTGVPGAQIVLASAQSQDQVVGVVDSSGSWTETFSSLVAGNNDVSVVQVVDGVSSAAMHILLVVPPPLINVHVISTNETGQATIGGQGQPGATISVTSILGSVQVATVDSSGNWSGTISNLPPGENNVTVSGDANSLHNSLPLTIMAGVVFSAPVTNPLIAGTVLLLGGLGEMTRRRRRTGVN